MDELNQEKTINVEGPPGKSIFHRYLLWCLPQGAKEKFQRKIDDEILAPVRALNDDRLLVLVGALVVENTLNELLAAIMPSYKSLQDNKDFTFSMRIEIAKALQLIPSRILNCVDFIRYLRNDFVHDLSVEGFDKLEQPKIQSIQDRLSDFTLQVYENNAEAFRTLVVFTALAMYGYTLHVSQLNNFIRSKNFKTKFKEFVEMQSLGAV